LFSNLASPVTVDDQAIVEVAFALERHYQVARADCQMMVEAVLNLRTVAGDYTAIRAALNVWATHPKLSLPDCYVAEKALAAGAVPLWTFDRKLASQHPAARLASG